MSVSASPTIAIIGGGQLGMLLCQAARDLGVRAVVVMPEAEAPATPFADQVLVSAYDREGLASEISQLADFVTFEFEDVPVKLLEELAEEHREGRVVVRPGAETLLLLKNKGTQKAWYRDHGFPTLPYTFSEQPLAEVDTLVETIGLPLVQKSASGGYDGYGVQIIYTEDQLDSLWDVPSVIEAYLDDPLELGVVVARSPEGELLAFQPVRMGFDREKNILDAVHSPTGLDAVVNEAASSLARAVVDKLGSAGIFAVELFQLPDGQLMINEISPRVHNSGHHTIEACKVSQFEQHVRAVCGLPLIDPGPVAPDAIMRNLLYTSDLQFLLGRPPETIASGDSGVFVHWYGKREAREGRKMGHVTCLCSDAAEARRRIDDFIQLLKQPGEGAVA